MDTNVHGESTEYTEETENLADVGHGSGNLLTICDFDQR